jgi:putative endonuclease
MFHLYILKSQRTGRHYIGQTNNLEDRIYRHNSGRERSTKSGAPWDLIFSKSFPTRAEAFQLEQKLKGFKSRNRVLEYIKQNQEEE